MWLYVIIISRTSLRVNLQSIVCLNVKKLLARGRRHIWSLSDSSEIQIYNHLVRKRTLNHLTKLAGLAKWSSVHLRTKWLWVQISLLWLKFLLSFLFLNGTLPFNNLKTRTAINAKISVFIVCVEAIIRHLLIQIQQKKHQNNLWILFKVNNKDNRTTSVTYVQRHRRFE